MANPKFNGRKSNVALKRFRIWLNLSWFRSEFHQNQSWEPIWLLRCFLVCICCRNPLPSSKVTKQSIVRSIFFNIFGTDLGFRGKMTQSHFRDNQLFEKDTRVLEGIHLKVFSQLASNWDFMNAIEGKVMTRAVTSFNGWTIRADRTFFFKSKGMNDGAISDRAGGNRNS